MKASKETKILAILLALFLLIGIGCGVAVATSGPANGYSGLQFINMGTGVTIDGTFVWTASAENTAFAECVVDPENHTDKGWYNTLFEYPM